MLLSSKELICQASALAACVEGPFLIVLNHHTVALRRLCMYTGHGIPEADRGEIQAGPASSGESQLITCSTPDQTAWPGLITQEACHVYMALHRFA